jgi:hypothetical protein
MRLVYDLLDKPARVLRDMVPYKRPRLTAMKVSGDQDAPLFNLSTLSYNELAFLRSCRLAQSASRQRPASRQRRRSRSPQSNESNPSMRS